MIYEQMGRQCESNNETHYNNHSNHPAWSYKRQAPFWLQLISINPIKAEINFYILTKLLSLAVEIN